MIEGLKIKEFNSIKVDLRGKTKGQIKTTCPFCSTDRTNKTDTCLSINIDSGMYLCHNCGAKGNAHKYTVEKTKTYSKPKVKSDYKLTEHIITYFKDRAISNETLVKAKVTSYFNTKNNSHVIEFNYIQDSELINVKYRKLPKSFMMVKDAELILYNIDGIKDVRECVCVEGEIDALSYIEAGIDYVVSVPNGANKGNNNLTYLDSSIPYFMDKDKVYLATDNDEAGLHLRAELVRRLGAERCYKVDFKDCKDANEFLVKYGRVELADTISNATAFPIEGIVFADSLTEEVKNLYSNGFPEALKVGWKGIDEHLMIESGRLMIITGSPSSGKSEFVDLLTLKTAINHNWKWGVFSPENFPIELHIGKLAEKIVGRSFFFKDNKMSLTQLQQAQTFINDNYYFVFPDESKFNVDYILERARWLIFRYGIKGFIIDPYASLDYSADKQENETTYISRFLEKIRNFARLKDILFILVAHPTKLPRDKNNNLKYEVPTLYSIAGSAHFYNKADYGISIYRDRVENINQVHIQKVRFKHLGTEFEVDFKYNINNGRLDFINESGDIEWDNTSWFDRKRIESSQEQLFNSDINSRIEGNINFDNIETPF